MNFFELLRELSFKMAHKWPQFEPDELMNEAWIRIRDKPIKPKFVRITIWQAMMVYIRKQTRYYYVRQDRAPKFESLDFMLDDEGSLTGYYF